MTVWAKKEKKYLNDIFSGNWQTDLIQQEWFSGGPQK